MTDEERAFATICPICQRRYGIHDDVELRVCFPALVSALRDAKAQAYEEAAQTNLALKYQPETNDTYTLRYNAALDDGARHIHALKDSLAQKTEQQNVDGTQQSSVPRSQVV